MHAMQLPYSHFTLSFTLSPSHFSAALMFVMPSSILSTSKSYAYYFKSSFSSLFFFSCNFSYTFFFLFNIPLSQLVLSLIPPLNPFLIFPYFFLSVALFWFWPTPSYISFHSLLFVLSGIHFALFSIYLQLLTELWACVAAVIKSIFMSANIVL